MPADRHDDRAAAQPADHELVAAKHAHIREHVRTTAVEMRSAPGRGARSAGGIDGWLTSMVRRYANHTRDGVAGPGHGDGTTNDTLRAVLAGHRREMQLAALAGNVVDGHDPRSARVAASTTVEVSPPRDERARDPRSPASPSRPSITTLEQKYSYGPQNFSRSDVVDRPRGQPALRRGAGHALAPPAGPPSATGLAALAARSRGQGPQR